MSRIDTSGRGKRSPAGRPPLPPHLKRSHVLEVAVNDHERAQLVQQAQRRGLAPSAFVRDRALGLKLPRAVARDGFDAGQLDALNKLWLTASTLRKELAPLANNCNQLAHQANAGRFGEAAVLLAMQELTPLVERLRQIESEAARLLQTVTVRDDR
ncbi:hypothetical protein Pla108_14170 [Botrimarina colliarenosi]|uniref:Uncharacterized protein n=1 Tax=Botrimarina colliarenosi TaxID=2528001 RepID=A0A5C6AMV8_9BACT|nr:plasmid mobilization relaxosome protein MobC [Botrimarina colliarenosi]TWU00466.1 hypothetical protein Pla108_14170 [Botrimarina colliarenosi]